MTPIDNAICNGVSFPIKTTSHHVNTNMIFPWKIIRILAQPPSVVGTEIFNSNRIEEPRVRPIKRVHDTCKQTKNKQNESTYRFHFSLLSSELGCKWTTFA